MKRRAASFVETVCRFLLGRVVRVKDALGRGAVTVEANALRSQVIVLGFCELFFNCSAIWHSRNEYFSRSTVP